MPGAARTAMIAALCLAVCAPAGAQTESESEPESEEDADLEEDDELERYDEPLPEPYEPECHPQLDRITDFTLEVEGGAVFPVGLGAADLPGYAARVSVGYGGRSRGWPVGFHILLSYRHSTEWFSRSYLSLERKTHAVHLGPRLTVPLVAGLRLFGDFTFGAVWAFNRMRGLPPEVDPEASMLQFGYAVGAGAEYRFVRNFSAGLRFEFADEVGVDDDFGAQLVAGQDGDPGKRIHLAVFAAAHF